MHCSYKDGGTSPAGFRYGTFSFFVGDNNDINKNYVVSTEKKSDFVRGIFDNGRIQKIKGQNGDSYYFIVKRLKYTYSDKKDVTISIGFEFSNSAEYKTFCQSFEKYEEPRESGSFDPELCKKLADCIIVDRKNDYGYVVDKKLFNAFVDDMLSSKTENKDAGEKQNSETDKDGYLVFVLKSKSSDYSEDLKKIVGTDEMPERKENSPVYIFGKKKLSKEAVMSAAQNLPALLNKMPKKMIIPVAIVIVVIALAINTWLGIAVIAALAAARKFLTKHKEK